MTDSQWLEDDILNLDLQVDASDKQKLQLSSYPNADRHRSPVKEMIQKAQQEHEQLLKQIDDKLNELSALRGEEYTNRFWSQLAKKRRSR